MSGDDNPLSGRFDEHAPGDEEDSNDTNDTHETSGSNGAETTDETSDQGNVRERKQEAMYLRPAQRQELREFYDELDARSKLAGEGGLAKNDDFYEAFVSFVIDEHRDEFKEFLELDDVE